VPRLFQQYRPLADISLASSGNVIGVTMLAAEVVPMRLKLLHQLAATATIMAQRHIPFFPMREV
jgi:hypothetical protein